MRVTRMLILLGVAGCASAPGSIARREFNATLSGRGETPNARASVQAVALSGRTDVAINLAGGAAGGTHPWHIHSGTCETGGPIVGGAAAYPPLRPDARGTTSGRAVLDMELSAGQSYHVNVHRAPDDMGTIISCGDLQ